MTLQLEKKMHQRRLWGNERFLACHEQGIDFSSNDYLGLARSCELAQAVMHEWKKGAAPLNGLGSTGSRLLTGNSYYAHELEKSIAAFHGYETALLFSCGYMANSGLLSSITQSPSTFFFDAHIHASIRQGMHLSPARALAFRHNDCIHLEKRLQAAPSGEKFICIESIYSTDGSQAPLQEIAQLAKNYSAHLIVDEAHAVGVYGPEGRGCVATHKLTSQVFAQIVTFSKALGTYGAAILGSCALKKVLINFAPSFIYTTALPFISLAAIKCSYDLFPRLEKERQQVQKLIYLMRALFPTTSTTQIQSLLVPGNERIKRLSTQLAQKGVDLRPLLSPTVQKGREVLRMCLHAFNTEEEVRKTLQWIQLLLQE